MKFFGQTKDGVIDNLLRAYGSHASRPSNTHQVCTDFDPDQSNAYIERSLTGASRLRYEAHLSKCATCRKSVVALVRLAETDKSASVFPRPEAQRSTWLSTGKQMFGALSQPQWAMAAAAVIVLAISLPLVLLRSESRPASTAVAGSPSNQQAAAADAPASLVANPQAADSGASSVGASRQRGKSDEKTELLAKGAPADSKSSNTPAAAPGVDLSKKTEARGAQLGDEVQGKSDGQLAKAPAQGGAVAPGSQVTRSDSEQSRQQQPEKEKDSVQQASDAKAARSNTENAEKEKVAKAEEVAPPPAPASPSEVARERAGLRRPPAKLALRDSGPAESVRLYERKLSGKKFLFKDGAWTDKDFDPDKDLPVVTIIRDSNVYKEVLGKRPGLKPFLTGFSAADRAIIVYKGTVYKLIPQ